LCIEINQNFKCARLISARVSLVSALALGTTVISKTSANMCQRRRALFFGGHLYTRASIAHVSERI
jgi:hypothetical protein